MKLDRDIQQIKDDADSRGGIDAFPYDPKAHSPSALGLEKLRAIEDRRMKRDFYDLYFLLLQSDKRKGAPR